VIILARVGPPLVPAMSHPSRYFKGFALAAIVSRLSLFQRFDFTYLSFLVIKVCLVSHPKIWWIPVALGLPCNTAVKVKRLALGRDFGIILKNHLITIQR
jgi:hypothetical protein